MKKIISAILLIFFISFSCVFADVYVKGHTKKNGTYVAPHYRSSPDGSPYNNWSYPGNTNPYTGKTAGGSESTYLNNYYNSNSYSIPSYTSPLYVSPSYTSYPSYVPTSYVSGTDVNSSSYESIPNGYKSYGILFCNSGTYKSNGSCITAPANSTAYGFDNFYCNTGYVKDSANTSCVSNNDMCISKYGAYGYYDTSSSQCACGSGSNFYKNTDGTYTCKTYDMVCQNEFGTNSHGDKDYCYCNTGYEFSFISNKKYCIQSVQCSTGTTKINNQCIQDTVTTDGTQNPQTTSTNTMTDTTCKTTYGSGAELQGDKCYCSKGYMWNTNITSCIEGSYKFNKDLSIGSKGDDVVALKNVLAIQKLYTGFVNTPYDSDTKIAVKYYQEIKKIRQTGAIGPLTRAKLNE